jgi:sugar lactone lactonase YvrE
MRHLILLVTCLGLFLRVAIGQAAEPAIPPIVWEVSEGLKAPESAYYDAASGSVFVSNVGGGGAALKDGDGYIAKLTLDGKLVKSKWQTGLNAPKGLRSHDGVLWVSDIDRLVGMDIAQAKTAHVIPVPGAKFLNDVACGPDGAVYVSDMLDSKIYRYHDGKLVLFAEGEALESPNGLLVEGPRLIVAAWGYSLDFSPKTPGRLFALDLQSRKKMLITPEPTGNLDGVETDGAGGYLVTDWSAGKVLRISATGQVKLLFRLPQGTADHAYLADRKLLILPRMNENRVTAFRVGG